MLGSSIADEKVTRLALLEFLVEDDSDLFNVTCCLSRVEIKEEDSETTTIMKSLDSAESKREIKEEVNDICEYEDEDFCNNMSLMEAMGLPTSFINKSESNKKRNLPTSEIAKQQAWKDYWCSEGFNIVKKVFSEDYKLEIPDNGTNVQLLIFHNTSVEHLSFKPSSSLSARDNINFDASIDKSQKWISVWKLCCEEQTKRCYDLFMENYEKWSTIDASSIHRLAHLELMKLRSDHCAVLYADCDGGDSEDKVLKNDVALCD